LCTQMFYCDGSESLVLAVTYDTLIEEGSWPVRGSTRPDPSAMRIMYSC